MCEGRLSSTLSSMASISFLTTLLGPTKRIDPGEHGARRAVGGIQLGEALEGAGVGIGREAEGQLVLAGVDALRRPQQGGEEGDGGHVNSVGLRRPSHIGRSPLITPYLSGSTTYLRKPRCSAVCEDPGRARRAHSRLPAGPLGAGVP